jgi:predicted permease
MTMEFVYLPVIAVCIIAIMYVLSFLAGRAFKLPSPTMGVLIVGTMILNNGFLYPFIIAAYGDEGLARILTLDVLNGFLAFTWVYYLACRYGSNSSNRKVLIKKFLSSPPIWAIIISIILNVTGRQIPPVISGTFEILGDLTIPLIMLALGIYFTPKLIRPLPIFTGIAIRMLIGLLLGFAFAEIFGLTGLTRNIVLLGASAPIGFNTLTFASLEDLDKEFAASLLSFSIVIGMIYVPLFIIFMG